MSMSAKELLKFIGPVESGSKWEFCAEHQSTILRALSLLAAVEDGDEIARELREVELNLDATDMPVHSAAVRAARARITLDAQEIAALKAKLASVKAHAEAMADAIQFSDMAILTVAKAAAEAYRAAHPKEGA